MSKPVKIKIVFDRLPELARKAPEVVEQIVRKAAFDVEAHAKESMEGAKTGRVYGRHRASAPGEAPAVDTGTLKNSIGCEFPSQATAIVHADTEYAQRLEFGTRKMAPRPFMRPAAEKVRQPFIEACMKLEERLR